jgi:hypothetical protein
MHLERLGLAVPQLERHVLHGIARIEQQPVGIEQPDEDHHHPWRGQAYLGEPALAGAAGELGPIGQRGHGRAVARRVEHRLERHSELVRQLAQVGRQCLHDLLGGALLQLA